MDRDLPAADVKATLTGSARVAKADALCSLAAHLRTWLSDAQLEHPS